MKAFFGLFLATLITLTGCSVSDGNNLSKLPIKDPQGTESKSSDSSESVNADLTLDLSDPDLLSSEYKAEIQDVLSKISTASIGDINSSLSEILTLLDKYFEIKSDDGRKDLVQFLRIAFASLKDIEKLNLSALPASNRVKRAVSAYKVFFNLETRLVLSVFTEKFPVEVQNLYAGIEQIIRSLESKYGITVGTEMDLYKARGYLDYCQIAIYEILNTQIIESKKLMNVKKDLELLKTQVSGLKNSINVVSGVISSNVDISSGAMKIKNADAFKSVSSALSNISPSDLEGDDVNEQMEEAFLIMQRVELINATLGDHLQ